MDTDYQNDSSTLQISFQSDDMNEQTSRQDNTSNKRKRIWYEQPSITLGKVNTVNVETTQILDEAEGERYHSEIHKRDIQIDKLYRQLQLAVAEEEALRLELKDVKSHFLDEKLEADKKAVESDSRVRFLTTQLHEWKEKAMENERILMTLKRRAKMEVSLYHDQNSRLLKSLRNQNELLRGELEGLKQSDSAESVHSGTIAMVGELQAQLRSKENALQRMEQTLIDAKETLESAETVRLLNEKIQKMELDDKKHKEELKSFMETAKNAVVIKEKLYQALQQVKHAEDRNTTLQEELSMLKGVEETHKRFIHQFHSIARDPESCITLDELEREPGLAVLKLYKARQEELESLTFEKGSLKIELQRVQRQSEAVREEAEVLRLREKELEVSVKKVECELAEQKKAAKSLQHKNIELVEILQTYANHAANEVDPAQKPQEFVSVHQSPQNAAKEPTAISQKESASIQKMNNVMEKRLHEANAEDLHHEKPVERNDFNSGSTKVLHLALNPTSELLEQKHSNSLESSDQVATLKTTTSYETVEGQKLLNQRLKEVFRSQIQQYREAVYLLTGYKVDLNKANGAELLRLRSMYAAQRDDELLVRMDKTGNLELLDTDYSRQIDQRVLEYLTTCRSFPAFLGTLTLHLFERQTFQGI
ncbi:unnamed protein product [Albugo candida]|uniref:Mitotic spindle assembly checkpoint protein MAD1 n=1 Tax=Albugo candida TaxID=65357 RepID=A0A024GSE5_9STRA|nr:unnamed protein product [Albugo candida]|eukprot:CCI49452.1 unnamed protein product [Albugo candida]